MGSGFVYLVGSRTHKWFKIGTTRNSHKRLRSLQQSVPFALEAFSVIQVCRGLYVEKLLHKHFRAHRIHGEWFSLSEDAIASFATIVAECDCQILNFRYPRNLPKAERRKLTFSQKFAERNPQVAERGHINFSMRIPSGLQARNRYGIDFQQPKFVRKLLNVHSP
jgi:hypothetical protein